MTRGDVSSREPCPEQQIVAKGNGLAQERDLLTDGMARGAKLAPLVEFTVVGQIGLGHNAQYAAAVDDDRAVEETVFEAKRGSDQ